MVCLAVETCVNGKEALKLLRDKGKSFDLVLSDVYMPGAFPSCTDSCRVWGRGLLAHPLVVESAMWSLQIWTASGCWNKWGWRWIFQS